MSRVLILFFAPVFQKSIPNIYHQFAKSFQNHGHDVLLVNNFIHNKSNGHFEDGLVKKIIDFTPDLIISYNHVMNQEIYENTQCPLVVIEADTVEAFPNLDLLKKFQSRIYLGIVNTNRYNIIKENLPFISKDKIMIIKNSTILEPKSVNQDINISCIATLIGIGSSNLSKAIIQNLYEDDYINNFKKIFHKALNNWNDVKKEDLNLLQCSYVEFFHFMSFYTRLYTLDNIASLGLNVYGHFFNLESILNLNDLFFSLKNDKVLSIFDNQNIYNRSKLSINVHFIHNIIDKKYSGYSWRVPDIMATNSCLVSTFCPALDQDFGKWVKIPQFSNRHEAYDLCKKLLAEENLRKDIVAGSQLAIKEGKFTFYDRVEEIEQIFNLKKSDAKSEISYEFLINNVMQNKEINNKQSASDPNCNLDVGDFYKKNSLINIINRIRINLFRKIRNKPLMHIVKKV